MKPSSAKAKGRSLQDAVKMLFQALLPLEDKVDVKTAVMGESGADIKFYGVPRKLFNMAVECKNVEKLNLWSAYDQAISHKEGNETPVVFCKKNRREILATIPATFFFELLEVYIKRDK